MHLPGLTSKVVSPQCYGFFFVALFIFFPLPLLSSDGHTSLIQLDRKF